MKNLRVIDDAGNKQDYEVEFVPRLGERIALVYGENGEPTKQHHFRVKDVEYNFANPADIPVRIWVEEERESIPWPE